MSNPLLEISAIFILLLINGVFAMSEIAVVSVRKTRLMQLIDEGNSRARIALELAEAPNHFLATIQTGITLVGILAGAFSGATIGQELGVLLDTIPVIAPYGEPLGFFLVVLAVTYFSLVIGELVPKRVALANAERIAMLTAPPMKLLSRIARPIVWLLGGSTDALVRLLGVRPSDEPSITEEEIKVLIDQGTQVGIFDQAEQSMIDQVLRLDKRRISLVMTPRPQIDWLEVDDTADVIFKQLVASSHSHFPVCDGELDNVLGIVRAKDVLAQIARGEDFNLHMLLQPILFVPENIFVMELLDLLKEEYTHIALVTDEYGSIEGLITPIDILETIVGDIPSLEEVQEPLINRREDGTWLVDGMLQIDQFKQMFGFGELPEEEEVNFQTVGGFVINQIGSIPEAGEYFEWNGVRLEVVDMDGRRVDKVLLTPKIADS